MMSNSKSYVTRLIYSPFLDQIRDGVGDVFLDLSHVQGAIAQQQHVMNRLDDSRLLHQLKPRMHHRDGVAQMQPPHTLRICLHVGRSLRVEFHPDAGFELTFVCEVEVTGLLHGVTPAHVVGDVNNRDSVPREAVCAACVPDRPAVTCDGQNRRDRFAGVRLGVQRKHIDAEGVLQTRLLVEHVLQIFNICVPLQLYDNPDALLGGLIGNIHDILGFLGLGKGCHVGQEFADVKLYSINNKNEGKTKEIQKLINNLMPSFKTLLKNIDIAEGILSILSLILERDENFISIYKKNGIINFIFDKLKQKEFNNNLNIIKILIILAESEETSFDEIISMNLINKINYLIDKSYSEKNITATNSENDEENYYLDYVFELFYDIMLKIGEYKKIKYPKNVKIDLDSYNKNFLSKVENIGKNFYLCIKLLGNQKNVNIQEMSCVCLINMLLIFPNMEIKNLNLELKFKSTDIPNLLKGLELSCYKIHKKMINILDWIIQFQDDANKILKPYVSYIITYLENIINTSAEPDVISTAQNFINNRIVKIK